MRRGLCLLLCVLSFLAARSLFGLSFEERVAAQRAIERVYYNHRIWPKENPGSKPAFGTVTPTAAITRKVDGYLLKSAALEQFWQRPITGEQLQQEINRMVSQSKDPEMLAELFAALKNDPALVAECLARPILADRLVGNWFAHDERIHGNLRQKVVEIQKKITALNFGSWPEGQFQEVRFKRKTSEADNEAGIVSLTKDEFDKQAGFGRPGEVELVETDTSFVLRLTVTATQGDRVADLRIFPKTTFEEWARIQRFRTLELSSSRAVYRLPSPESLSIPQSPDSWAFQISPLGRQGHTAVWTGSEMIIWGGFFIGSLASGARYSPTLDSWTATNMSSSAAPVARSGHSAVWTGSEMIVWGGSGPGTVFNTGGQYNPVLDQWTATNSVAPGLPSARVVHTAVWTGNSMIVWGGRDVNGNYVNTGGIYRPGLDAWTSTDTGDTDLPCARYGHTAIWTGDQMIVWGGFCSSGLTKTGGSYSPGLNTWTTTDTADPDTPVYRAWHSAVWTGSEMILWGGYGGTPSNLNTGGRYNPVLNAWSAVDTSGPDTPAARYHHTAIWTGNEMIVWGGVVCQTGGGCGADGTEVSLNSGSRYDASANTWIAMATTGAPVSRGNHTAVWTGSEMIVWGGANYLAGNISTTLGTGGRYNPDLNSWIPTPDSTGPTGRQSQTAIWTGSEMIIWGGSSWSYLNSGSRYTPATDSWVATNTVDSDTPSARGYHTATWTGTEMAVWGGTDGSNYFNTGSRYDPGSDNWISMNSSSPSLPSARINHTAVWTGNQIVIWGGGNLSGSMNSGGRYNPGDDTWLTTNVADPDTPSPRWGHTAVWTGSEMLVRGGIYGGGKYEPSGDSWSSMSMNNAPSYFGNQAIWTGSEMIVWAGWDGGGFVNTGKSYSPVTDQWIDINNTDPDLPEARRDYVAVWTGTEMIVWGGKKSDDTPLSNGGRYDRANDTWNPLPGTAPLISLATPTAVWTGAEMILWGTNPAIELAIFYPNTRPVASFIVTPSPLVLTAGSDTLSLDGTASTDGSNATASTPNQDKFDSIVLYEWDLNPIGGFNCMTAQSGFDYASATPIVNSIPESDLQTFGLAQPGSHTVWLRVTDEVGVKACSPISLNVVDAQSPLVKVVTPDGGESWAYSPDPPASRQSHLIVWAATDNFPPVARTRLSYSTDGSNYTCIADSSGSSCPVAGLSAAATSYLWQMPTQSEAAAAIPAQTFPTTTAKIKVEVWDSSNNSTPDTSDSNFYIIQPTTSAIETLILWNSARMEGKYPGQSAALLSILQKLAGHNKIAGVVLDLNTATTQGVPAAYAAWNGDLTSQTLANNVASTIRNYILAQLATYNNARYLILVGDDYQVPFYRMTDGTTIYPETSYVSEVSLDTTTASTVGAAVAAGRILTDGYYSDPTPETAGPFAANPSAYLNDLAAGRLVETPAQITGVIDTYFAQDGQLNVTSLANKVLVTGVDFLFDSATDIRNKYVTALKTTECLLDDPDHEVGGACTDEVFNAAALQSKLLPLIPHSIANINTHANHFNFAASAGDLLSTAAMNTDTDNLTGTLLYTSGCHSGLPVPPVDTHSLDLPELMANKKVVAYIGNTGYAWGMKEGTGLTENLMRFLTNEILGAGSISIGRALDSAKREYFTHELRYDVFDEKVVQELTLYGIPNYLVVTSLGKAGGQATSKQKLPSPDGPDSGCANGICVQKTLRSISANGVQTSPLPPDVTELNLNFRFGAATYTEITTASNSKYWKLNGESSGETGDIIQPHFVYDSKLSGTVAHGVVWLGGTYIPETPFDPVIAVPRSTNADNGEGSIPGRRTIIPDIRISNGSSSGGSAPILSAGASVPSLTNLVVHTGYYDANIERRFSAMQFSAYYSNSLDNTAPTFGPAPDPDDGYATINGSVATFNVPVTDNAGGDGLYRVLITYNDDANLRWQSMDLTLNGGVWTGTLNLPGAGITYFAQSIDNAGNVGVPTGQGADLDGQGNPYGSQWSGPITYTISPQGASYLYSEDFEDGLAQGWTSTGGTWTVNAGNLLGTSTNKVDDLSPAFSGCSNCTIEADMKAATSQMLVTLLGWYQSNKNYVELILSEKNDTIQLKHHSAGSVVAKKTVSFPIDTATSHRIKMNQNAKVFQVYVDGSLLMTVTTTTLPSGTKVGFRVKPASGTIATGVFGGIWVY